MKSLSIITINYNNIPGLQKTMDSVFVQHYRNFEYIIIDGGSTDGSKALIEAHAAKISLWVSEKDHGIYHAMNKGITAARGEYLLFLNSGDFLLDEHSLEQGFFNNYSEDIICADLKINAGGLYFTRHAPDTLSFDFFTKETLPHQSAFIKRELFERAGLYDEDLKFVADWKFYLDVFCKFNATYRHIPETICEYNYEGASSLPENADILHKEREDILTTVYPMFYADYKKYDQSRAALKNYTSSRAHRFINRVMQWPLYRIFIKKDS
jgi:glycosyltransferase involved in cell wall biosynthesis